MAFEDVNTQGSKKTNGPWQLAVLKLLKGILTNTSSSSSGGALNTLAKGATVAGNPTSRSKSADVTALDVQIVDASGAPITTFGGSVVQRTSSRAIISTVGSGTVGAGTRYFTVELSNDFIGNLGGDNTATGMLTPGGSYTWPTAQGSETHSGVSYTLTAGRIAIQQSI